MIAQTPLKGMKGIVDMVAFSDVTPKLLCIVQQGLFGIILGTQAGCLVPIV
jgi:hypothetical protein